MQGAQQAQGLGEALIGEKGLFGEKGLAGKAIKSLGLGSAPPAAAPPPAQVPETGQPETTARKEDTVKNARGGLIPHHYADGGMPYGGDPTLADVLQEGKNEIRQLPKPGEPPKQQSGLGQVADLAKGVSSLYGLGQTAASAGSTLMDFLPAVLALKQGGLVPRHAYADGGDTGMPSDDELAIRTMLSEVGRGRRGEVNPQEALGVGAVIANRARSRGLSPGDVVLQSGQFEPWARAGGPNDPMKWDPSSQAYQEMASYWQRAKAGEDPTGGASHFYGPASQSALGRAAPSWASSPGVQLGATSFHRVENVPQNGLIPTSAPRESDFPAQDASEAQLVRQQDEGGLGAAARAILPTTKSPTGEESINWKQILIPALSGLGAMASSPSRYLGSAILQGIGKGAESYANLEKLQADIGQTQAQTERLGESSAEIRQLMAKGDIFVTPNGQQMVLLPGGVQISYGEWLKRGKPPTLSTSRFGPYTPPGAQPSTGTQGAPGAETVSPPALPKPLVSLADANAEKALREGPKILGQDPTNNPFTVTTQRADAARNDMPQTLQYARVLADLPANYSGPIPAQIITPLIQKVNSLLGAVGAPQIPQTGEPIAAKEVIDKIAVGLARARQAGTGGAVAEFEALLKAVPTDWNSKLGQSQLVSSMLAEQRMALEEDKAYNAYRDYIEKKYGLQGNESQFAGRGLRQAFSEQYQSQFQQDKKILQHMFLNEFKDKEGKPALVMKDVNGEMKPVSVLSYLIQNAGSPGNDRIRKALEAQYGANNVQRILGYFGRQ
jgi:hypothetical protein